MLIDQPKSRSRFAAFKRLGVLVSSVVILSLLSSQASWAGPIPKHKAPR